jgi:hypothetical protein
MCTDGSPPPRIVIGSLRDVALALSAGKAAQNIVSISKVKNEEKKDLNA